MPTPAARGRRSPDRRRRPGRSRRSKEWFNDGRWWAILYRPSASRYEIFRDDGGTWTPTGTVVDTRHNAYADALWDGSHLNVVSATMTTGAVQYSRFSYDPQTVGYTRDVDPVDVTDYGVEAAVLDRDATGTLWVTFTHDSQVWVAHSTGDDAAWSAPFVLPVAGASTVSADDMSSVVRYDGHVGVMFSNQNDWHFYFASHADGDPDSVWQESVAMEGAELADDHINLKALEGDPAGQVFAAVKTSLNAADDPLIKLLVLDDGGSWFERTVFTVGDQPTRAQVMLDPMRRQLHVFAAMGPCCAGGTINVKSTSLDDIAFADGPGDVLMQSDADTHLNNPTTTKQAIDPAMPFLPVLAADDSTHRLWQNVLDLPGGGPGAPPLPRPQPKPKPPAPAPSSPPPEQAGTTPAPPSTTPTAPPPPPQQATVRVAVVPLAFRSLRLSPATFRRATTIHFRLNRAGRVVFTIQKRSPRGRWVRVPGSIAARAGTADRAVRLAPDARAGSYRLVARVGLTVKRVAFRIRR